MVNFDPDSARAAPEVLMAIVRVKDNKAGVYGTVTRRGRLAVGQPIFFERTAKHPQDAADRSEAHAVSAAQRQHVADGAARRRWC